MAGSGPGGWPQSDRVQEGQTMGPDNGYRTGTEAQGHEPLPQKGTVRRERDGAELQGLPASWDYPLLGTCQCGTTVRRQESLFSNWEHTD
jgi:hypothetical protein